MIVLFHALSVSLFWLFENRKRRKYEELEADELFSDIHKPKYETKSGRPGFRAHFSPPLYLRRRGAVLKILVDPRWRTKLTSLVDFGCGEIDYRHFLYQSNRIQKIYFVDIDKQLLLDSGAVNIHFSGENIKTIEFRREILRVKILAGSVSDPDEHLKSIDVVTAVEVIEHLYPDILEALPYNIFKYIQPKIAIFTTPNSEYNVFFFMEKMFRHYDHKFEWTREQFQDWANNITARFPYYTVYFTGVGPTPEDSKIDVGYCTQIAVFVRKDLLLEPYLLEQRPCICDKWSPCKRLVEKNLIEPVCPCVCDNCVPYASYGICTYHSYSEGFEYEVKDKSERIVSQHYFELLKKIEFDPPDGPTEEEMLIERATSYLKDRKKWTTPGELMRVPLHHLRQVFMSVKPDEQYFIDIEDSEVAALLREAGFRIEQCPSEDNGDLEYCVVFYPDECPEPVMEQVASTSEPSGYDTDYENEQLTESYISDSGDPYIAEEGEKEKQTADTTCLEVIAQKNSDEETTNADDDKKLQDSLFDSGYQKSLSLMDDSPQTPLELEETDIFEDTTSTPSLTSEDNKVHLKKASALEKLSFTPPPPPDFNKFKFDLNRVNEMDKLHNISPGRTFFNHFVPPPDVLKKSFLRDRDSLPGPSSGFSKKRKKFKKGLPTDADEDSPFEDVKSITNCLIENTLNKLDVKEDKQNFIEYVEPEPDVQQQLVPVEIEEVPQIQEEAPAVVENGDLANNNRDIEGNNYIAPEEVIENIGNDIVNDNLDVVVQLPQIQENNANFDNNNREGDILQVVEDPIIVVGEAANIENADNAQEADSLLGEASREALFDPNSEQDSLDDFEIPAPLQEPDNVVGILNTGNNVVFIGVHPTPEENETGFAEDENIFPHWLLQILGSQVIVEGDVPPGSQEEPHFYCQGDGLGVHPSVIAVEIDEEEEDDDTTDSSNNTAEFADLDQGPSSQDTSSLPEDSQLIPLETNETEQLVTPTVAENHEFLEPNSNTDVGASGST